MNDKRLYRILLVITCGIFSLKSWGGVTLPQLRSNFESNMFSDTLPGKIPGNNPVTEDQPSPATDAPPAQAVIKQVPKSRKKPKPAAVTSKISVPPTKIIKPRVVIKKIKVNVP